MFRMLRMIFRLIVLGIIIYITYIAYESYKSGDIKTYLINYVSGLVIKSDKLSAEQKEYIKGGDYESLVKDFEQNITGEQIDCAIQTLGEDRANELLEKKNPTPQEILKLSKCL